MADDQPASEQPRRLPEFTDLFEFADIEFRPGSTNEKWEDVKAGRKPLEGLAVPYITAHAAQERLDAVCSARGWYWSTSFREVNVGKPSETHVECTITIDMGDRKIQRADVGEGHDNDTRGADTADPVKTAYSDAFKRACSQLGIGRFLRRFPKIWVPLDPEKYGRPITEEGFDKIEHQYDEWVGAGARPARGKRGSRPGARPQQKPQQAPQQRAQGAAAPPAAPPPSANGNSGDRAMTSAERTEFWTKTRGLGYSREDVQAFAMADGGAPLAERTKRQMHDLFTRLKAKAAEQAA